MTRLRGNQRATVSVTSWLLVWTLAAVFATVPRRATADTFNVPAGDVDELIAAIEAANSTPEADTIILAEGTYTLVDVYAGTTGLPSITSPITIEGNGAIIERSSAAGTPSFRIFFVMDLGTGSVPQLTLNDLTVRNGRSDHPGDIGGGGILIIHSATATLTRTTVSGNSAGRGGGIWSNGTLVITRSTISGNSATQIDAGNGGGIYNTGILTITESTVSGNRARRNGGGIFNEDTLFATLSTLSDNRADDGGGIFIASDTTVTLINSTLSGNSAVFDGGGIRATLSHIAVTLINSTLAGNSAGNDGGGIFAGPAPFTVTNVIVANSPSGGNCLNSDPFDTSGNNLATDGTCGGVTQVTSGQLNLGPLFNNGGPTRTHALLAGSVAIDAGDQGECFDHEIVTDQRGFARDSRCDIGAFEFGAGARADLLISQSVDKIGVKQGDTLTYFITVQNLGPDTAPNVVVTDTISSGTTFLSVKVNKGSVTAPPVGNTGTVTWYLGDMSNASSETAQLAVTVLVKGKTTITNTAEVSADVVDPNLANNSAAITVSVAPGSGGNGKPK